MSGRNHHGAFRSFHLLILRPEAGKAEIGARSSQGRVGYLDSLPYEQSKFPRHNAGEPWGSLLCIYFGLSESF